MTPLSRLAVVQAYAAAWNEPSADKLRTQFSHFWTEESIYEDPNIPPTRGSEALIAIIAGLHTSLPGVRLALNSAVDEYRQVGRFHWVQHQADGTTVYGTDFVGFNERNQLVRVTGFFGHQARLQP